MTFPLNVFDLEVGKLYKGGWKTKSHKIIEDSWLYQDLEDPDDNGQLASLSCFVFLGKQNDYNHIGEAMCKILTSKGEIGWVCFVKGTHWFIELTGDKV